jgi:hypothetical protein
MVRHLLVALAATVLVIGGTAAPAGADTGWHRVTEEWQPYHQAVLTLPAERYCGDFDLRSAPLRQDIRYRVLSRWDSGAPRTTEYAGPLVTESTNVDTGAAVRLNMSGHAVTLQREDGSLATYESSGPVGMGFPAGSVGLETGFYLFEGYHVVEFPADGPRRLVVDRGTETNICHLVD